MFRILAYCLIVALVYQERFTLFGNSLVTIVFLFFAVRLLFIDFHWNGLNKSIVVLSICAFILFILIAELFHAHSSFQNINRVIQTFFGAIVLYLNVRSINDYKLLVNLFYLLALIYSFFVILYGYENLFGASIDSWQILQRAFGAPRNPNDVGYVIAVGISILLFRYYFAKPGRFFDKFVLSAVLITFFVALLIIGKRTGVLLSFVAPALAIYYFKEILLRKVLVAVVLFILAIAYFGGSIIERTTMYFEDDDIAFKDIDGRARLYEASKENIPKIWLTGVGSGNYYGAWGRNTDFYLQKSFARGASGRVSGAHNLFFQFIIFWGIGGVLLFCKVLYDFLKMLPSRRSRSLLQIEVFVIFMCTISAFFLTHVLATKEFSVAFAIVLVYHFKVVGKK